jgi:site-specific DNA-methyltransferase (adenine-specific)
MDAQSGETTNTRHMSYKRSGEGFIGSMLDQPESAWWVQETGGASRFFQTFEPEVPFFYTAKASKSEKEDGLQEFDKATRGNTHPTVKPIALMRYLVKMITPKGGIVLDPFAGSGSTLVAALEEGDNFVGIEREDEYIKIARKRIDKPASTQAAKDIFDLMMSGNLSGDEK